MGTVCVALFTEGATVSILWVKNKGWCSEEYFWQNRVVSKMVIQHGKLSALDTKLGTVSMALYTEGSTMGYLGGKGKMRQYEER